MDYKSQTDNPSLVGKKSIIYSLGKSITNHNLGMSYGASFFRSFNKMVTQYHVYYDEDLQLGR